MILGLVTSALAEAPPTSLESRPIVERLNQNLRALQTVKAFVEMVFLQPGFSAPHDCLAQVAVTQQGELYLKGFDVLAPHYFTLVVTQEEFSLMVPKQGVVYQGPLDAIGSTNFQLELNPWDLRRAFLPEEVSASPGEIELRPEGPLLKLSLRKQEGNLSYLERALWLAPPHMDPILETYFTPQGNPFLEIGRKGYSQAGSLRYPMEIKIKKIQQGSETTLRLKKFRLNVPTAPKRFELLIPEGISVEKVGLQKT